jgi:glutathionylspermidine synthase
MPSFRDYTAFAEALQRLCVISDPWIEGRERFRLEPLLLSSKQYAALTIAAEAVAALYDELCGIVWERPSLLDEFFHLTPYQKLMWLSSGGRWHGIARLDVFICRDGTIQICEMNSDTPSGEAEAVMVNEILRPEDEHGAADQTVRDPNDSFAKRFASMLWQFYRASVDKPLERPRAGIIYPTEMTEDLSMILLYKQWLEDAGFEVIEGSPFNIHALPNRRVGMFGKPIDIALRHYKTDWWGEREPVWLDAEDFPDPEPLEKPLQALIEADAAGTLAIVNPFGAALTQNKLTMAFCWQHTALFSEQAQRTIRAYIPETKRLADIGTSNLQEHYPKDDWVLKSDYGCEGDEVIIGRAITDEQWNTCCRLAKPEHWIVQRFFDVAPISESNSRTNQDATHKTAHNTSDNVAPPSRPAALLPNYGVYVIAGQASGIYTRLASVSTDYKAQSVPTYIIRDAPTNEHYQ